MSTFPEHAPRRENELNKVEKRVNARIDKHKSPEWQSEISREGERLVRDFFNKYFSDVIRVRPVSSLEDAESITAAAGHHIGAIAYSYSQPVMAMEIATDPSELKESLKQLKDHPSIRLRESGKYEVPVPKVFIRLEPELVESYMQDYDISKHANIEQRILDDTIASLKYSLDKSRDDEERRRTRKILEIFVGQKDKLH
jgi:hypothetical protein